MLIDVVLFMFLIFSGLLLATGLIHLFYRVPFVPTPKKVVKRMIEIAKLKKGDKVYDLGCGDGRLIIMAEETTKTGGVGYELAPVPYIFAKINAYIHKSKAELHLKSLFYANLKDANVLFCYLMPHMLKKLSNKIKKECRPGTKIVSHGFKIEGLEPKEIFKRDKATDMPTIYLYEIS